jgi:Na+/melibiose symporter-like transporter
VFIFQFGWASTQVSHMALIPDLSTCENERLSLNAIRYAFTVISNLFVYGVTYLFFRINQDGDIDQNLSRNDASKFMYISFIVTGVGILFQIIFYAGTKEECSPPLVQLDQEIEDNDDTVSTLPSEKSMELSGRSQELNWLGYLRCSRFYIVRFGFY